MRSLSLAIDTPSAGSKEHHLIFTAATEDTQTQRLKNLSKAMKLILGNGL
jgi:hypothetical protein